MEHTSDSSSEDSDNELQFASPNDPIANMKRKQRLDQFLSQQESSISNYSSEDDTTPIACNNYKKKGHKKSYSYYIYSPRS